MKVKIRETNEIVDLCIYLEKGECTQEYFKNSGAFLNGQFVWDDDEDIYVADCFTVDWCCAYIEGCYGVCLA